MAKDNNRVGDGLTIEEGLITTEQALTIIMNQFEYDREEAETYLKELAAKNPDRFIWWN